MASKGASEVDGNFLLEQNTTTALEVLRKAKESDHEP